jgi:hypothetical protein
MDDPGEPKEKGAESVKQKRTKKNKKRQKGAEKGNLSI